MSEILVFVEKLGQYFNVPFIAFKLSGIDLCEGELKAVKTRKTALVESLKIIR